MPALCAGVVGERSLDTEAEPRGLVELREVRMLAWVTTIPTQTRNTVNPRFPWQWQSAKG